MIFMLFEPVPFLGQYYHTVMQVTILLLVADL